MRKRVVLKLAVMVAALGAVTLLQGCDWDDHGVVIGGAWMPVGMYPAPRARGRDRNRGRRRRSGRGWPNRTGSRLGPLPQVLGEEAARCLLEGWCSSRLTAAVP